MFYRQHRLPSVEKVFVPWHSITRWSAVPGSTTQRVRGIVALSAGGGQPGRLGDLRRIVNTRAAASVIAHRRVVAVHSENLGISFYERCGRSRRGRVPLLNTRANKLNHRVRQTDRVATGPSGGVRYRRSGHHRCDRRGAATSATSSTRSSSAPGIAVNLAASNDPQDAASRQSRRTRLPWQGNSASTRRSSPSERDDTGDDDPEGLRGEPEPGSLAAFLERVSLVADADQIPRRWRRCRDPR